MERVILSLLAAADFAFIAWHLQLPVLPMQSDYEFQYEEVSDELRRKAEAGDVEAQFELGIRLASDSDDFVTEEPFIWLLKAAEGGHSGAQNEVGVAYLEGRWGHARDVTIAAKWFQRSADGGDEVGRFNLAQLYRDGRGVERDEAMAAKLYRASAVQGYRASQFSVFLAMREGVGAWRDPLNAKRAQRAALRNNFSVDEFVSDNFELAGEEPDAHALMIAARKYSQAGRDEAHQLRCLALHGGDDGAGGLFEKMKSSAHPSLMADAASTDGSSSSSSESEATWNDPRLQFAVLRIAALMGDPIAQQQLSQSLETGTGVEKDSGEAAYWARRAAKNPLKNTFPPACDI